MEQFFGILQRGLGQLDATGEYEEGTLRELKESYQKFDAAMQQNMLRVIEQSLAKFPITLQIYIWSSLLAVLRDEKIIPYMGELTADDSLNLWQKVELMNQLQRTIFASEMIKDEEAEYKRNSDAYTALMDEIRQRNKKEFSYLPWEKRNKKIVLITKQFIGRQHAPTEITLQMNRYLKELGYEVVLYVTYMPNRNTAPLWYKQCLWNNFMNTAGAFQGEIEGEEIKGYNLLFTEEHYPEQLYDAAEMIWQEAPEWVLEVGDKTILAAYAGKTYQAVIGFQSYLFDIYLPKAGVYLHDLIKGPKINFQFDHPIWMKNHYIRMPEHCYIATHDRNYAAFIEKYYPRIAGSSIIFPGGCEKAAGENGKQEAERNLRGAQDKKEYQISFIGTYTDYRSYLPLIRNSQGIIKKIAAHFLFRMKQHPEETAEKALEESLRKDEIVLSDEEFLEVLDGVKPMIYCIMSYYREKAVKVILEAGITLEVFGDSWKKSPFGDSPYLRIHEAVDMRESLEVMEKSLISFNVMAWHKDGFTERIANSMLQHSVVLTDESTYLKEQFTDGKDILMYRLNELYKIQELLADYLEGAGRDNLQMIAENAYRKAKENYTWEQSAKKLLAFIDEIDAQERKCSEK